MKLVLAYNVKPLQGRQRSFRSFIFYIVIKKIKFEHIYANFSTFPVTLQNITTAISLTIIYIYMYIYPNKEVYNI